MKKHLFLKSIFLLLAFVLSIGQMWADATLVVGCAANNTSNYTVKLGVQAKDWDWQGIDMTKAGTLTFEGKKLYVTSYKTQDSKIIGEMKFMLYDGSTWKAETVPLSSWNENTDFHTNEIWNYDGSAWYSKMSMSQSKVYFDASNWSQTDIYMVIAHANYQGYYAMTNVANTKLYYTNAAIDWSDAMGVGVVGRSSYVTSGAHWINDISSHGGEYTGLNHYQLNNNGASAAYLIVNNGASGQQPTNDYNASYTTLLNSTQTIKSYVSTDNGSTYSNANSKATITITSFAMSSQGTSGATSSNGSLSTSAKSTTVSSARTATTTLSVGAVADGFVFVGWYNSSDQLLSSSTSYTYYPTGATEIRARFKNEISHTVTISNYCTTTSTTISSSSRGIGETTAVSITAPDLYGYTFSSWTLGDGVADQGSDLTANPISVKTLSTGTYTMRANYTEELETSPWYVAGESSAIFGGWGSSGRKMVRKTGHSAEKVFYYTIDATKVISGDVSDSDLEFKIYNSTADAYRAGADGYWITRSNTNTDVSTSNTSNMQFRPDAYGTYEFKLDCESPYSETTPHLTVTFNTKRQVNFGKRTGGNTVSAKYKNTVAMTSGQYVMNGSSVTFAQTANTGYTFEGWYNASTGGTKKSTSSSYTTTISGGDATMYSNYTENKTSITITTDGHGTITAPSPNSSPYSLGVATTKAINASANAGYTWNRWTTSGNATLGATATTASNTAKGNGTSGGTGTVTATFTANTWYVRFNRNGGTTGSDMANESFTYDAVAKALTTNTYTRSGYEFSGWATSQSDADAGTVTYADKATVRNLTTTANGIVDLYAVWTANNYTVSFNVNGGTADTPDSKEVTFGSAYGTLPGGMTHASKTFIGWYDDSRDGEGNHITAETTVSTASNHTLYAHYETVYAVDVDFKCGSAKVYPSTRVNASATSLAPTIIAPEVFGYSFTGWTGSNVTFADASNDTTTVKATAATTITANYAVVPTVYFKNNLGWDSVFVTFNCGWATVDGKQVPSNKTKPYYKMTQIGSTDIYYCEIPSTYTASDYASWAWNIAFDNKNYGGHATSDHIGTWDFYGGEFTGRGDFDPKATLFIPYNGDTETRNTGTFYQSGCWMKYNSTESGYEVKMNTWVKGEHADTCTVALTAANAGGYEFSAKIHMERANYSYGFKLYKPYQKNTTDLWYTNTGEITATTETLPWNFWSGSSITANSDRCGLHTEALGDYTITVSLATGKPMVDVEYPASVGDWRLAYNDLVAWSGDAHDASWYLYSRVIKAKADAIDTVSFYVSKAVGANAHVELQKCTAIDAGTGAETWTKQGSNLDLSGITGTGIYNFKVTQNGSKVATAAYDTAYVGNFYIRTDASDGGWNNYISSGKNQMTYSEYAKDNSGYTHYFTRYVTSGSNIKFCIANDYSECLTEYCISDDYTNEYIEANGNVRFMWDHRTNAVSRAYISGSSIVSDRFLVLEGDALLFNESGQALTTAGGGKVSGLNDNEMNFRDDQNWIYEATVKAKPGARIKLTAKYNNKIQYFYGNSGSTAADSVLLLGGSDDNQYKIRVVYDFKTNRLIKAFIPDGNIGTELAIDADMMIIREHQEDAQQVTFTEGGSLSKVNTVYGAMKFNKYTVNGKEKTGGHGATGASRYERDLFYISFPFDVKLSDAFGFGTYGKHWIIEYYDGVGRAKNGFWADSPSNWKFVMPAQRNNGFVMKAFEGYILALELDEMAESSSVWDNGVEDVYIYFPSADSVKNIQATNRLIEINQDDYECTIGPRFGGGDDRRVKDSYWHCIGVPSFANYSSALAPTSGGTTIDWRSTSMPYLYEWNSSNNTLAITSSATFSFKATWSYLVQYAGESIYWSAVNATPASIVARERTAPENAEFRIELQKAGEKADQAYVRLTQDENVTTGYDFNYDLSKEFNKNKANIYTMVTTIMEDGPSITEVAGNVQPMTEQTTVIPVGVKIATTGDYTFAIPDGTDGIGVTLIDNETGIRTSLSAINYTINLSAGTYNNRFVLEISPIKPVATGVEVLNGENGENGVRKVMIDGLLYIVKNGKMYDARGAVVK